MISKPKTTAVQRIQQKTIEPKSGKSYSNAIVPEPAIINTTRQSVTLPEQPTSKEDVTSLSTVDNLLEQPNKRIDSVVSRLDKLESKNTSRCSCEKSRIICRNANGLTNRSQELENFLHSNSIDIALISETHLTTKSHVRIYGYQLYHTPHPDGGAHSGAATIIKNNLFCQLHNHLQYEFFQGTAVTVKYGGAELLVASVYCPPEHSIKRYQFGEIFHRLGAQFVCGSDFNAKHLAFGSRLTITKGRQLYEATNTHAYSVVSAGRPTYWPSDPNKIPDFICKGLS
jgi:hypothetical protein